MELTARDWMVIVGVLLILAVLLDAGRRIIRERRAEVRLNLSRNSQRELDSEDLGVSSPRVVRRREQLAEAASDDARGRRDEPVEDMPMVAVGALDEQGSLADDPEAVAANSPAAEQAVCTDASENSPGEPRARRRLAQRQRREPLLARPSRSASESRAEPVPDVDTVLGEPPEPENLDWLDALEEESEPGEPASAAVQLPREVNPEVFMFNVVARKPAGFAGEDILHILLACDLRFGDLNFFHRHEQAAGRGPIQFSVANMLKPGVFDIDHMADFRTQGLTFFLTLPGPENMMRAFDYMLETAQTVARNLDGDVLDETRSALTRQTLEHHRQRIRDLERRMLLTQPSR